MPIEEFNAVTPVEAQLILTSPAVFINKFIVSHGEGIVRISLLEVDGNKNGICRGAFALSAIDALGLASLIQMGAVEKPAGGKHDA